MSLFKHTPHSHHPVDINEIHRQEQRESGFNQRIAIALTKGVGSMETAYIFALLAIVGLFAILGLLPPVVALLVAWTSQTLIQLVLLPVIMVGQNVLGRKSELQAEEQFNFTEKSYHDIEEIMQHLSKQDDELLEQSKMIKAILEHIVASKEQGQ